MLLYWGIFTLGFTAGSIIAYLALAPKNPEDDPEFETPRLLGNLQVDKLLTLLEKTAYRGSEGKMKLNRRFFGPFLKKDRLDDKSKGNYTNQISKINRKWFSVN